MLEGVHEEIVSRMHRFDETIQMATWLRKVKKKRLEYAVDGAPSQIPTLAADVANSMTDGRTCSPTPLP